ncbi:MAG: 2-phosphosulfolactate phosphatase [Chloroflexi bacterium]|nr:2-phosphosulfolactate phosphatase [Chloroflexota bacterium]MCC6893431.1 2-phosphosulfolactate phosphatase [Anaerolineae bacterium]
MNVRRGSLLADAEQVEGLPIIIDVLRAFTTSPVLFSLGIESLILVSTAEEAFALREKHGCLLAGENNGIKIDGFDFGNSPTELLRLPAGELNGKTVVLRTSAGTQGVVAAMKRSQQVILGSFVMAKAIAAYVRQQNPDTVSMVAMGQRLLEKAPEDEACAAYFEHLLAGKPYDHYAALWECINTPLINGWLHGGAEHIPPEDIFLCLQRDLFDFVLVAEMVDGVIRVSKVSTDQTG